MGGFSSEVIGGADPRPNGTPEPGAGGKKEPEVVTLTKKEHEALLRRLGESEETARYWADHARSSVPAKEPDPELDPEPEDLRYLQDEDDDDKPLDGDTPDKFLEDLGTNGVAALQKRGLLTKKDAQELIAKIATKAARQMVAKATKALGEDAKLIRQFPELDDNESPLFKRTSQIYRELVTEDPNLKKSPTILRTAAKQAKLELAEAERAKEPPKRAADKSDDGNDSFSLEDMINAQGEIGTGRRGMDQEDDETLSEMQRGIIARFNRDGVDLIDEEGYKKRARRVQMGGVPIVAGRRSK